MLVRIRLVGGLTYTYVCIRSRGGERVCFVSKLASKQKQRAVEVAAQRGLHVRISQRGSGYARYFIFKEDKKE